jgi:hypothetical protein
MPWVFVGADRRADFLPVTSFTFDMLEEDKRSIIKKSSQLFLIASFYGQNAMPLLL